MSVTLRRAMTVDEFLDWEERQELRWEFDGVEPFAMTGGTLGHAAIQRNIIIALAGRLRGQRCQVLGSHLKIRTRSTVRYPDAFVICTRPPARSTVVDDPVVIFEVLSPSTASIDLVAKNQEYRDIPSVQRYVMLEQDRIGGVMFARVDGDWRGQVLDADATLAMPEIAVEVPMQEFYEGVAFEPAE